MRFLTRSTATGLFAASSILLLPACGESRDANRVDDASQSSVQPASSTAATPVPDACTFIPKDELESLVGRELRDGEHNDAPTGFSQCDFETPTGLATTRRFDNPPLPDASGFSSITITTHPTTPETFAQSRQAIGAGGEQLQGIGDGAYLEGLGSVHVRVGNRGAGIRLHVSEPKTDGGRQTLRKVMLGLAQTAAGKL